MRTRAVFVLGIALVAAACTRAGSSDRSKEDKKKEEKKESTVPTASRARARAAEVAPIAERADLTKFAASADDKVAVLIRFDRLRGTALGRATEKLLSKMPDHPRVIGSNGPRALDLFDLLLITSSSPSQVTATNMSAAMRVRGARMRDILDNDLSKVTWKGTRGGAMGTLSESTRFPYKDPRVYLTPLPRWIVLVNPATLGHLTEAAPGGLDDMPKKEQLVPWITRLPRLFDVGDSKLIALATLARLPESVTLPLIGKIAMARRASIALVRHRDRDVFSGTLSFATARDAEVFEGTIATARMLLPVSSAKIPPQFQKTVGAAVTGLIVERRGTELRWSAPMSRQESANLTLMAAEQLDAFARGGWTFHALPKSPQPPAPTKSR